MKCRERNVRNRGIGAAKRVFRRRGFGFPGFLPSFYQNVAVRAESQYSGILSTSFKAS